METTDFLSRIGTDLGYSDWFLVDQQRVNDFADVTIDHQFIHVDEAAAAASPLGGTIAHGFLTLSLLVHLASQVMTPPDNLVMSVNYGFNKIRFLAPVRVGAEVRAHVTVADVIERGPGQFLVEYDVTVEIRGEDTPALVARWLTLQITSPGGTK